VVDQELVGKWMQTYVSRFRKGVTCAIFIDAHRRDILSAMLRTCVAIVTGFIVVSVPFANGSAGEAVSPVYGVTIPNGYRQWQAVAPSEEAGRLNEIRIIFGNAIAMNAFERGKRPFPNGSILVKVGWKRVASARDDAALGSPQAFVPGRRSSVADVQVMVKDTARYAASGGWGYGKFENGAPLSSAIHQTCFACHAANARANNFVFTRYAP
jgi:hypothetical protein